MFWNNATIDPFVLDREKSPFAHYVPKNPADNVRFRKAIRKAAAEDKGFRSLLREICRRDLLFFVGTFGWTHDPRITEGARQLPFISYPFQDEALLTIDSCIGKEDLGVVKSRDIGASWLIIYVFCWRFMFRSMESFTLASRNEDFVDKKNNPDCLFWKVDFVFKWLPQWLRPKVDKTHMTRFNVMNGCVMNGAARTGDLGRGGRRTAIELDEHAAFDIAEGFEALNSTQHNSPCRIFLSTPKGMGNAFHHVMHNVEGIRKVKWFWWQHPLKARGLYTADNRKLKILDTNYEFPKDYPFKLDGDIRSPWYDYEEKRLGLKTFLDQELNCKFVGAGEMVFDAAVIDASIKRFSSPPVVKGFVDSDHPAEQPGAFLEGGLSPIDGSQLNLWLTPMESGRPHPAWCYIIGVDVSQGKGASISAVMVVKVLAGRTCETVATFVTARTNPYRLADIIAPMGRWFKDIQGREAQIIWETQGPGLTFGDRLNDLGYQRVYYRTRNEKSRDFKKTMEPGWTSTGPGKQVLLNQYFHAMIAGKFVNHCKESMEELKQFEFGPNSEIIHQKSRTAIDPSGARANHGDRAIAAALAYKAVLECDEIAPGVEDDPFENQYAPRFRQPTPRQERWAGRRARVVA